MTAFETRIDALRRRFVAQAVADAARIEERAIVNDWNDIRQLSHGLAGRAGMFGFAPLSNDAGELERAIEQGADVEQLRRRAHGLINALRDLAQRG
jgi:HPt (histidine-containing phosphotransfer) domain-containing protein